MSMAFMCLGWWAAGFVFCHLLLVKVGDPCPCPKCWIGSIVSLAYGLCQYFFLGLKGGTVLSSEYFYSAVFAALIGGAICRIICPIRSIK
jgi:hypothetical protein